VNESDLNTLTDTLEALLDSKFHFGEWITSAEDAFHAIHAAPVSQRLRLFNIHLQNFKNRLTGLVETAFAEYVQLGINNRRYIAGDVVDWSEDMTRAFIGERQGEDCLFPSEEGQTFVADGKPLPTADPQVQWWVWFACSGAESTLMPHDWAAPAWLSGEVTADNICRDNDSAEERERKTKNLTSQLAPTATWQIVWSIHRMFTDEIESAIRTGRLQGRLHFPTSTEPMPEATQPEDALPAKKEWLFQKRGDDWLIGPEADPIPVRDLKGFSYIAYLLERPNVSVETGELSRIFDGTISSSQFRGNPESQELTERPDLGDAGDHTDRKTLRDINNRLQEIDREIQDPQDASHYEAVEKLKDEKEKLLGYVRQTTGLGGRLRKSSATNERERSSVTYRIKEAIKRLGKSNGTVHHYLSTTIKTGNSCAYKPAPDSPIKWTVSF
jgi:hypothetical protein